MNKLRLNAQDFIPLEVTLVIPTFNRAEVLSKSLSHYSDIEKIQNVHILIIDNGSTDRTKDVVDDFMNHSTLNIRYCFEPKVGLSHARNRAIAECSTDFLVYLDDDCYPSETFIIELEKWLLKRDVVVTGMCSRWDEMTPKWVEDSFYITNPEVLSISQLSTSTYIKGGVLLTSIDVLNKIGGFDESLGMSGEKVTYGEDTKFGDMAIRMEIPVYFDPGLNIFHKSHFVSPTQFLRSQFNKGYSHRLISGQKLGISRSFLRVVRVTLMSAARFLKDILAGLNINKNIVRNFSSVAN
ncbi:MAG: glycosyltransferase family 2 protein, partial [Bacteroidia bacterium]